MSRTFDVVVIGAGPGGYVAALRAVQNGLSVALVEKEKRLGGTCLLRGCIPTKSLLESARRFDEMTRAADFGIDLETAPIIDLSRVMRRKERVIAKLSAGVGGLCKKACVTVIQGTAQFLSAQSIRVTLYGGGEENLHAHHVIIASGSSTRDLPNLTPDHHRILTSDSALALTELPRRLIVLGSGAVGVEFASIFRSFGAEVTIVELMGRLLPLEDEEVSHELERAFRRRHIDFFTSATLCSAMTTATGVQATLSIGGKDHVLEAEALLIAIGRIPNTQGLGLEPLGIELERGYIPVDASMQTRVPGVYAIGDLVSSPALAHVASHEGRIAADAIAGKSAPPLDLDRIPSAVYASPEIASVGLTEATARARGIRVRIGKFPFAAIGKASVQGDNEGFAKLVADDANGRLIGAQLIGPHATELLGGLCAALTAGMTLEQIAGTVYPHPTLSEVVAEAALAGLETPLHL